MDQILVPVKALVELPGIEVVEDLHPITYHHLCCDSHEIMFGNGAAAETFYPGPQALKSLPPKSREFLLNAAKAKRPAVWKPVRPLSTVRRGASYALRTAQNGKAIVSRGL